MAGLDNLCLKLWRRFEQSVWSAFKHKLKPSSQKGADIQLNKIH